MIFVDTLLFGGLLGLSSAPTLAVTVISSFIIQIVIRIIFFALVVITRGIDVTLGIHFAISAFRDTFSQFLVSV